MRPHSTHAYSYPTLSHKCPLLCPIANIRPHPTLVLINHYVGFGTSSGVRVRDIFGLGFGTSSDLGLGFRQPSWIDVTWGRV